MQLDRKLSLALAERSPDALLLHDEFCRFVWVNRRACELLGRTEQELLGADLSIAEPDFDRFGFSEALAALGPDDALQVEGRPRAADGTQLAVEVTVARVAGEGGEAGEGDEPLYLASVRDITRRTGIEDARRDSLERAERERRGTQRRYDAFRRSALESMRTARGHALVLSSGAYGALNETQQEQLDAVMAAIEAVEALANQA